MSELKTQNIDFGQGFWKGDRKVSGRSVDGFRGQNIPFNSKTIDRTVGLKAVVSHKSTDIRLKSYRSAQRLYRLGTHFVRQLMNYQGEIRMDHKIGATYNLQWAIESPESKRILEWFIPDAEIPLSHKNAIQRVIREALESDVMVEIYLVKDY